MPAPASRPDTTAHLAGCGTCQGQEEKALSLEKEARGWGKRGSRGARLFRQARPQADPLTRTPEGALHFLETKDSHRSQSQAQGSPTESCIPRAPWAPWHCCGATRNELLSSHGAALARVSRLRGIRGKGLISAGPTDLLSASLAPHGVSSPREKRPLEGAGQLIPKSGH